ncbi:MAG TPA: site-specific integrase, partial [Candidatus Eisenbacteria bacterium]|nr:site-specific integrase [Candidatus Eisenbacteria bacterium]
MSAARATSARTPVEPAVRDALDRPIEAFLDELRTGRRLSENTLDAYARDLADYRAFARRHRLARWDEAGVTFVDGYFAHAFRRGLSGATLSRRRSALRGFHRFLERVGTTAGDPLADSPPPRRARPLPHVPAVADIERLLAQPAGEDPLALRDRAMLELAYASGLRVSELVGLERARVNLGERIVAVLGKGRRERVVPFGAPA